MRGCAEAFMPFAEFCQGDRKKHFCHKKCIGEKYVQEEFLGEESLGGKVYG